MVAERQRVMPARRPAWRKWVTRLVVLGAIAAGLSRVPKLVAKKPVAVKTVRVERARVRDVVTSSTAGEVVPSARATSVSSCDPAGNELTCSRYETMSRYWASLKLRGALRGMESFRIVNRFFTLSSRQWSMNFVPTSTSPDLVMSSPWHLAQERP